MKKKEAKRLAKAEKKASLAAGEDIPEPVITLDEFGNVVEILPETDEDEDQDEDEDDDSEDSDPA